MLCPICSQEMSNWETEFMVATEVPYTNVYVHKECRKMVNLNEFMVKNAEKWYTLYIDQLESKIKKGKLK